MKRRASTIENRGDKKRRIEIDPNEDPPLVQVLRGAFGRWDQKVFDEVLASTTNVDATRVPSNEFDVPDTPIVVAVRTNNEYAVQRLLERKCDLEFILDRVLGELNYDHVACWRLILTDPRVTPSMLIDDDKYFTFPRQLVGLVSILESVPVPLFDLVIARIGLMRLVDRFVNFGHPVILWNYLVTLPGFDFNYMQRGETLLTFVVTRCKSKHREFLVHLLNNANLDKVGPFLAAQLRYIEDPICRIIIRLFLDDPTPGIGYSSAIPKPRISARRHWDEGVDAIPNLHHDIKGIINAYVHEPRPEPHLGELKWRDAARASLAATFAQQVGEINRYLGSGPDVTGLTMRYLGVGPLTMLNAVFDTIPDNGQWKELLWERRVRNAWL